MKVWVSYAILSMIFAGVTSVLAKKGLEGISGELGLAVRTVFIFALVAAFAFIAVPMESVRSLKQSNLFWLGISAVTTTASWIFYYKALEQGKVSTIALIDKGSILVAIVLAAVVLKERIGPQTLLGGTLVMAGLWVISHK